MAFQGFQGVKYGDPLSPILNNLVVDAVVQNWVVVMVERAGGQDGRGR